MKKNLDFEIKPFCPRCGSIDVKVLSTGEILCKNPKCLAITKIDYEKGEITTKIKIKDRLK